MPSEDAKTATQSVKDEDEDGMSLGSILKDRKNKALNATLASSSKPRPKEVKVKKGEAGGSNDGSDRKKPMKPGSVSVSVSGPGSRVVKVKKEEKVEEDDDDDDDKPISRKMASVKLDKQANVKKKVKQEDVKTVKVEVKRKISTPGSKEVTVKKREKKVYDLPGQKRDPPEERDPLRIFYESLYKQMPRSEMAQFWMMESGLLPKEEAKKVFDKKQRKSQAQKLSSPAKSAVAVQRNSQTLSIKKKDLSSSLSSKKKMDVKTLSKQLKKRKDEDTSFGEDSDDDFVISRTKKQRTAD